MDLLFYFFSCFALVSGSLVIQSKNPVYSVLFLILVFFNSACLLILLGQDFFALIFLVVYVGAIAVLFLFVVMMLNIKLAEISEKRARSLPIGAILGLLFLVSLFLIVDNDCLPLIPTQDTYSSFFDAKAIESVYLSKKENKILEIGQALENATHLFSLSNVQGKGFELSFMEWSQLLSTSTSIQAIGLYIYTYYFLFFLLASLILLVAMIGAIVLTMSKKASIKRQKVFRQNTREFAHTVSRFS